MTEGASDGSVTALLARWSAGDGAARDRLLPLVYDELHAIAARLFRRERAQATFQATAIVHEVYLRLHDAHGLAWENRRQFLGFAAHLIRRILIELARARHAAKRGGEIHQVTLSEAANLGLPQNPDLLALDDALTRLAEVDARKARVIELRFFGGLTLEETAEELGVSPETVGREWRRAKAWLFAELSARTP